MFATVLGALAAPVTGGASLAGAVADVTAGAATGAALGAGAGYLGGGKRGVKSGALLGAVAGGVSSPLAGGTSSTAALGKATVNTMAQGVGAAAPFSATPALGAAATQFGKEMFAPFMLGAMAGIPSGNFRKILASGAMSATMATSVGGPNVFTPTGAATTGAAAPAVAAATLSRPAPAVQNTPAAGSSAVSSNIARTFRPNATGGM